MAVLTATN